MGRAPTTRHQTPNEAAEVSPLAALCRPLIEASPVPMAAVAGPHHVVCAVNAPFCRLIGAPPETVLGQPFAAVVPAWAGSSALFDRVARTGQAEAAVDQPQAAPGAGGWSCLVWPVRGPRGHPAGLLLLVPEPPGADPFCQRLTALNEALVVSSVAQQERTDTAEALTAQVTAQNVLLERILEQAAEEIVVRDREGRLLLANAEARRWLQPWPDGPVALEGTPLERSPQLWGHILDTDEKPIPLDEYPIARALRGERGVSMEIRRPAHDGTKRALINTAAPLVDPQAALLGAVAINIDITSQKDKEDELRRARDELELRVAERTAALEAQAAQLRALASELTLAEQRERQRLAQMLHDELQQLLVAAKFRVGLLRRVDDHTVGRTCQELQGILDECVAASRALTSELSPPVLQSGGLLPGLEWLSRWMVEKHGLTVLVEADGPAVPASEAVNLLLFQSVRELLFNTVKHAQVTTARVAVQHSDGYVTLIVSDSGVGFDPQAVPLHARGGFGLFSIRERLEFLGGRMEVVSAPGHGCRTTLSAPLHPTAPVGRPGLSRTDRGERHSTPRPSRRRPGRGRSVSS